MFYNSMIALEVTRLVQQERLAEAQKHRMLRDLELANRLEMSESPWNQMRKVMSRVMSLLF